MHSAPAVSYPVGRSRFHGALVLALATLGTAILLTWVIQADEPGLRHLGAGVLCLLGNGLAAWHWVHAPQGQLTWDGIAWTWTQMNHVQPTVPEVTLDLQTCLVLRLYVGAGQCGVWVWPERRAAQQRWRAFRRAVFGRKPVQESFDRGTL